MIDIGTDFCGVGAFHQALIAAGISFNDVFACDKDVYSRKVFLNNYEQPADFPHDVYDRTIPKKSLDIYMTSPPCQAFSMSGKRKGKQDVRGVLFFNSLEFIQYNKPRFFIFENVKGLLSHDSGKTYSEWINHLGGKSIDGNVNLFPMEDAVPYHIYAKVINSKHHGVPQNRERIFIVGIRDDADNNFQWPVNEPLKKSLMDLLENDAPDKYFLSESTIEKLIKYDKRQREKGTGFRAKFHNPETDMMSCLKVGGRGVDDLIKIKSEVKKGNEIPQKLDTTCLMGTIDSQKMRIRKLTPRECFRLMDFPDTFDFSVVSDSQAYKQAGNSIVVRPLKKIIQKLIKH